MKTFLFTVLLCSSLISCDWAKDKAKNTLHKGGEIVGKAGSEVVDGVAKGVETSFANLVEVSPRISEDGIRIGRVTVTSTDSTSDNLVSVYLIFDKNYSGKITAKALDGDGLEFGRSSMNIVADAGSAKFVDFEFDRRTNIDRNDRVRLE
jgi:hypothetical protein